MMPGKYTMVVIDDIKTVVNGIVHHIPWEKDDIQIVGTAFNGEDGIELIRETQPHLILSDIRMPKLDGLEMIRVVMEEKIPSKIIFLSGYTDFDYARQAIRLGAFDFIQKPFTPNQLREVVLEAKRAVKLDLGNRERIKEMESKIRESLPILQQEFFRLLLRYPSSLVSVSQRWDFLQIAIHKQHFIVMLAEVDHFAERSQFQPIQEVELIRFTIQNIMEETIGGYTKGVVFREGTHQFIAVFNPPRSAGSESIAEKCRENIEKYSSYTISVGLGTEVRDIQEISMSYKQAITALSYNFYTGGNSVYCYEDVQRTSGGYPRPSAELEKELLYCIRSGNEEKALESLESIFRESQFSDPVPDPDSIKAVYYEIAFLINRMFAEKIPPDQTCDLEKQLMELKNDSSSTLAELQQKIKAFCRAGCERIRKQQKKEANQQVEQVMAYIRKHLDLNLTVADYAKMVYLSGSYFSNLFKKVTGMTIPQFVTAERMEKAKEMLIEGMQVQEISLAVGYEDRPYFSELFKRHTGMTPSEFRQLYGNTNSKN